MARYKDAIAWIALNDDVDIGEPGGAPPLISMCLVADLFDKEVEEVHRAVVKYRKKERL